WTGREFTDGEADATASGGTGKGCHDVRRLWNGGHDGTRLWSSGHDGTRLWSGGHDGTRLWSGGHDGTRLWSGGHDGTGLWNGSHDVDRLCCCRYYRYGLDNWSSDHQSGRCISLLSTKLHSLPSAHRLSLSVSPPRKKTLRGFTVLRLSHSER
uniref:Uncharacterized protein n=1 Tax=Sinocyclocheilus anshuiensis TaxID=1608454 RepID=A0A671RR60_9TELE